VQTYSEKVTQTFLLYVSEAVYHVKHVARSGDTPHAICDCARVRESRSASKIANLPVGTVAKTVYAWACCDVM
jgi:hypothetical protein